MAVSLPKRNSAVDKDSSPCMLKLKSCCRTSCEGEELFRHPYSKISYPPQTGYRETKCPGKMSANLFGNWATSAHGPRMKRKSTSLSWSGRAHALERWSARTRAQDYSMFLLEVCWAQTSVSLRRMNARRKSIFSSLRKRFCLEKRKRNGKKLIELCKNWLSTFLIASSFSYGTIHSSKYLVTLCLHSSSHSHKLCHNMAIVTHRSPLPTRVPLSLTSNPVCYW